MSSCFPHPLRLTSHSPSAHTCARPTASPLTSQSQSAPQPPTRKPTRDTSTLDLCPLHTHMHTHTHTHTRAHTHLEALRTHFDPVPSRPVSTAHPALYPYPVPGRRLPQRMTLASTSRASWRRTTARPCPRATFLQRCAATPQDNSTSASWRSFTHRACSHIPPFPTQRAGVRRAARQGQRPRQQGQTPALREEAGRVAGGTDRSLAGGCRQLTVSVTPVGVSSFFLSSPPWRACGLCTIFFVSKTSPHAGALVKGKAF